MTKIRLVVCDDQAMFRDMLVRCMGSADDIEVVAQASNAQEAMEAAMKTRADVVLMDVSMPGYSCFDATANLKEQCPHTKVVFLSSFDDQEYLAESMSAGAVGYVLKDADVTSVLLAVRKVHEGEKYLAPKMVERMMADYRTTLRSGGRTAEYQPKSLTLREREILKMLAEGSTVKEIANILNLSVKTVEAHKFNMMRKLDIHNKAQLVHYAMRKKIIAPVA